MAAVHGRRTVTGICHRLGSLLWGTNGACLLRIAGVPGGLQAAVHTAVVRHRWWHGCTWPASPHAGGFAMGWVPGRGSGTQDGARCAAELLRPHAGTSCLLPPCPIPGLARCLPHIAGGSC